MNTHKESFAEKYLDYILSQLQNLLAIDSPSGYCRQAADYLCREYERLGYHPVPTAKGGVLVQTGEAAGENGVLLEAHMDTLGAIVARIKENGRLVLSPVGGMNANNAEAENCRVLTRFDGVYDGTFQLENASVHVNGAYSRTERSYSSMEVVLDEAVTCRADAEKLGIRNGDYVAFHPRTVITSSGYIKSRFLDDKLSVAILLGYACYLADEKPALKRSIWQHITAYEEVGHGGSASVPAGVNEAISVDMGCVGEGLDCTERMVSICAKDSGGPYHYDVVTGLVQAARDNDIAYAVDVYPHYGSDVEATLKAGNDLRHGLIGPGVYASHGYERSHTDGVKNTFALLMSYLG